MRIELKRLKVSLQNAQKDTERLKEKYNVLKKLNKSFSDALKNSLTSYKLKEADQSEETLNNINLVEERILVDSTHISNGLLYLNDHS